MLCALCAMPPLMGNTLAAQNFNKCQQDNFYIKENRAMVEVVLIKRYFIGNRKFVPTVDLSPAGKTGSKLMNSFFRSELYQVILVEQSRSWTEKTHIPLQDTEKLRYLVKTRFAQTITDRC